MKGSHSRCEVDAAMHAFDLDDGADGAGLLDGDVLHVG